MQNYHLWNSTENVVAGTSEMDELIALVGGTPWEDADIDDTQTVHIKPVIRVAASIFTDVEKALPTEFI